MNEVEAVTARAVAYAYEIVQRTTDPYDGAKALWAMEVDLEVLAEALRAFAGLASEWEDHPEHRAAYEQEIRVQADRLMARFGR